MTRQKKHLALAAALITGLGLAWLFLGRGQNRIRIRNESGQFIARLHVDVSATHAELKDIPPGDEVRMEFIVEPDSAYKITGTLQDGTQIKGAFGYVTHGMPGYRAVAIIKPGGKVEGKANW